MSRCKVSFKRALGCLLMLKMPKEGLDEALASLRDMRDFYLDASQLKPSPRRPDQQLTGRVGMVGKRPDLVIES